MFILLEQLCPRDETKWEFNPAWLWCEGHRRSVLEKQTHSTVPWNSHQARSSRQEDSLQRPQYNFSKLGETSKRLIPIPGHSIAVESLMAQNKVSESSHARTITIPFSGIRHRLHGNADVQVSYHIRSRNQQNAHRSLSRHTSRRLSRKFFVDTSKSKKSYLTPKSAKIRTETRQPVQLDGLMLLHFHIHKPSYYWFFAIAPHFLMNNPY